ncbi:SCO4225 family membrane protein [Streptomyces sp. NBC_00344]|uniref:SCO4225 family membrane protein n=1 Tax=Streptomyces sp. NBC_00344 TaxID=2975720 RepID=UPI002E2206D6
MKARNLVRQVCRTVAGDWVSRAYLAIAAGLLIWVWVDTAFVAHQDASFSGVWPVIFTAPTSLLFLIPGIDGAGFFALLAVAALVNSSVISLLVRRSGTGHRTRHTAGPASAR